MLGLRLAEFHELFIKLQHYFGPLPDEMVVQGPTCKALIVSGA
jgi:hypothetical protein